MLLPKPSKDDRKAESQLRHDRLHEFRGEQASLAWFRDGGYCVFCFFMRDVKTMAAEVHHVYGRGRITGDWREKYTSLVCTCRACHPQPVKVQRGKQQWQEDVLRQANEHPINPRFEAPDAGS